MTGPAVCPRCRNGDRLFTVEKVTGHAMLEFAHFENGVLHLEYEGITEMDYESSTTVGVGCRCDWRGMLAELVPG